MTPNTDTMEGFLMTLDLYAYGRSVTRDASRRDTSQSSRALDSRETFVCAGCGTSATAESAALVLTIGWRLLPRRDRDERRALCPRCSRRSVSSLM